MGDSFLFLSNICGILKDIKRTGWVRHKVPLPESDSDHMHRCAMCAMLVTTQSPDPRDDYSIESGNAYFHPRNIDGEKLLRMALTHDLCESIAGDVTPFCDAGAIASKHEKEKAAMNEIRKVVGDPLGKELFDLWLEYEEQVTPVSLYCKDIDKFEMVMQAYEYEKKHLMSKEAALQLGHQTIIILFLLKAVLLDTVTAYNPTIVTKKIFSLQSCVSLLILSQQRGVNILAAT